MRLIVVGDDLVALAFQTAAAKINDRLRESGQPVAESIADTQRQLVRKRSLATYDSISAVPGEDDTLFEIGPETFYSRFLENGTVKMPPYPFVGPSGDIHQDDWFRAAEEAAGDI